MNYGKSMFFSICTNDCNDSDLRMKRVKYGLCDVTSSEAREQRRNSIYHHEMSPGETRLNRLRALEILFLSGYDHWMFFEQT